MCIRESVMLECRMCVYVRMFGCSDVRMAGSVSYTHLRAPELIEVLGCSNALETR